MKKILFVSIALSLSSQYYGYTQDNLLFYYHNEHKIFINKVENERVIHFNKKIETIQKDSICNLLKTNNCTIEEITSFNCKISNKSDYFQKIDIISTAIEHGNILYIS